MVQIFHNRDLPLDHLGHLAGINHFNREPFPRDSVKGSHYKAETAPAELTRDVVISRTQPGEGFGNLRKSEYVSYRTNLKARTQIERQGERTCLVLSMVSEGDLCSIV